MTDEIEPISAEKARAILEAAIRERLGDQWDDEEEGWTLVTGHDYMARLVRGSVTLDFYVDLVGQVRVETSTRNLNRENGALLLAIMVGLSIVIALLIVRIVSGG